MVCACLAAGGINSFISNNSSAQEKKRPFCGFSLTKGWFGSAGSEYITRKAKPQDESGVPQVINQIYKSLGISPDIDILIAKNEDNAFATVAGGRKIIVVDVDFVDNVNRRAKTEWGAIQVIAHELGHHIAGFSGDSHRAELNADYWSGQALQRLGAARIAASKAILAIGSERDTNSHPSKYRRARVIEQGWDDGRAGKIDYSFCNNCK